MNIVSTGLPKNRLILSARGVDGKKRFFSIATMVCRLTPTASANCCWVTSFSARSILILFFILAHFIITVNFKTKYHYVYERQQYEIDGHKIYESNTVDEQNGRYQDCAIDI